MSAAVGVDTTTTYSYPAAGSDRPHALAASSTTGGATGGASYTYDAAGDTTSRTVNGAEQTLTWDADGHLSKVTGADCATTSYIYDAAGDRLIERDSSGSTLYLPGMHIHHDQASGATTACRYYSFAGDTVAVRTSDASGAQQVSVLADDALGTAMLAVDSGGGVTRRAYLPFGLPRGEVPVSWPGDEGFVGGVDDTATGLVHLGVREYDPSLGRFISADPIVDPTDPLQAAGYAYADDTPVTGADPGGASWYFPDWLRSTVSAVWSGICAVGRAASWVGHRIGGAGMRAIHTFQREAAHPGRTAVSPHRMARHSGGYSSGQRVTVCASTGSPTACGAHLNAKRRSPATIAAGHGQAIADMIHVGSYSFGTTYRHLMQAAGIDTTSADYTAGTTDTGLWGLASGAVGATGGATVAGAADGASSVGKALERSPWPDNDGFMHKPVQTVLKPGTRIDRFGGDRGRFVAAQGTPLAQRSMRMGADKAPYSVFEVQSDLQVRGGITAPAFGQPGGGIQYTLPESVRSLLEAGVIRRTE